MESISILLNLKEIKRLDRISFETNLLSIDFPFKPKRNLKTSIDRFVRISIDIDLLSIDFSLKPKRNLKRPEGLINYGGTLPTIWWGHGLMMGTLWELLKMMNGF